MLREYARALRRMAADCDAARAMKLVQLACEWEEEADRVERRPERP